MVKKKETKNTKQDLTGKEMNELQKLLVDARSEWFKLRVDNSQRKLNNTSLLTTKRKEIARILTKMRAMTK